VLDLVGNVFFTGTDALEDIIDKWNEQRWESPRSMRQWRCRARSSRSGMVMPIRKRPRDRGVVPSH